MTTKIIYLVDDDDDDRYLIRDAMESVMDKLTIIEFNNGIDFLEHLKKPGFILQSALVLLDINMPRMNGLEVLSVLKDVCSNLQVFAISTASDLGLVTEILSKGASGFYVKPASSSGLRELAENIKSVLLD